MKNFLSFVLTPLLLLVSLTYSQAQDEEFGLASYYSDEFHGRKTAYGDTYNKEKLTTAHKKHPYGTILKVTRLDNNKSVTVKVIDKGPFIRGRVVDLSRKAADRIGLIDVGVAEVKVEVVSKMAKERPSADIAKAKPKTTVPKDRPVAFSDESSTPSSSSSRSSTSSREKSSTSSTPKSNTTARSTASVSREKSRTSSSRSSSKDVLTSKGSTKSSSKARLVTQDYTKYGLYKIVLEKPSQKGYGVQVASLSNYENVLRQVADLQSKWFDNILLSVEKGQAKPIYKIILGSFENEDAALSYKKDLLRKHKVKGFVVNLDDIQY
ncbi:MAG: septal ring lytic transglycosylase RlpA family protein [Saprospiraceae bacterium]|nr:septal ring lytic transglycosylase RlpA family protein [Saprospiraceae bacterium]